MVKNKPQSIEDSILRGEHRSPWTELSDTSILSAFKISSRKAELMSYRDSNGDAYIHALASRAQSPFYNLYDEEAFLSLYKNEVLHSLLDIKNGNDETALHVAVLSHNQRILDKLIDAHANGSAVDHRNLTPMDLATWMGATEMVKSLARLKSSQLTIQDSNQIAVAVPIYQWGQMLHTNLSVSTVREPTTVLFNHTEHSPTNIKFGNNFAMLLTDTGLVYSWGLCSYGKLGHPKKVDYPIPSQIMEFKNKQITAIACGKDHCLALDEIGCVYAWGNNAGGRLGNGSFEVVSIPTILPYFESEKVIAIACGSDHSMALCDNGRVYSWGLGLMGKLGYHVDSGGSQPTPKLITGMRPASQIACGSWHSMVLARDGTVYTFGSNKDGRLGRPHASSDHIPTAVSLNGRVRKIGAGLNFCIVLTESNVVMTWGSNAKGQLGLLLSGNTNYTDKPQVVSALLPFPINNIEAGYEHSVVLTDSGEVYTFGDNSVGACGTGEAYKEVCNFTKVAIPKKLTVFKIAAGAYSSLISLSSGHHIFGAELASLLLADAPFTDLRIIAIGGHPDEYISCHRIIVATRCPKLSELLAKEIAQPNAGNSLSVSITRNITSSTSDDGIITLTFPTITLDPIRLLIKFLYTDHAPMLQEYIQELGEISTGLEIQRLSYLCNISKVKSLVTMPASSLLEDFKRMSLPEYSNLYKDITFRVIDDAAGGVAEDINSYKVILSLRSNYFKMMLTGHFVEKDMKTITMHEVTPRSFKSLLHYFYCNDVPEDANDCIDLLMLADLHQITRAKELCAAVIRTSIDNKSLCYIYRIALEFNVKPLIVWCEVRLTILPAVDKLDFFDMLPLEAQQNILAKNKYISLDHSINEILRKKACPKRRTRASTVADAELSCKPCGLLTSVCEYAGHQAHPFEDTVEEMRSQIELLSGALKTQQV
eukprot:gene17495-20873_t